MKKEGAIILFSFWIGALLLFMLYLCIKSILKNADIGTPPPTPPSTPPPDQPIALAHADVESQLSDEELSGSDRREESEHEFYPTPERSLMHDVPIPPPSSPMEQ